VIFRQTHVPGKMGLSDFTDTRKHGVSVSVSRWSIGCITFGWPGPASSTPMSAWAARAM